MSAASKAEIPTPFFSTHSISEGESKWLVREIDYQRNGVSGEGFYVVSFRRLHSDGPILWGIVFENPKHVAVVDPMDIRSHWRGDQFEAGLREVTKAWMDAL